MVNADHPANPALLEEIIQVIHRRVKPPKPQITADTSLLTELDIDSLSLLDLVEDIKTKFGVDLFGATFSMTNFETPRQMMLSIEAALRERPADGAT